MLCACCVCYIRNLYAWEDENCFMIMVKKKKIRFGFEIILMLAVVLLINFLSHKWDVPIKPLTWIFLHFILHNFFYKIFTSL